MSDQQFYVHKGIPDDLLTSPVVDRRRLKTESQSFDPSGNTSRNTITQEQLVASRNDDINIQFQYNVPYNENAADINGDISGTGSISHENSMAVVSSGTGVGAAYIVSRDSVRYFPGHEFAAGMTGISLSNDIATEPDTYARWGVGDIGGAGDAMAFGVKEGVFGAIFRADGDEAGEFIPHTDFNLDRLDGTGPSGFDINKDKLNLFTFRGGWYGILPLQYGCFVTNFGYITCHVIDRTNQSDRPHLGNPTLPMFVEVGRTSGSGVDLKIKTASWRGGICGDTPKASKANRTQVIEVDKSIPANSETPLFSLRNNTTFQGKVNHVRVRYGTVTQASDGTKPVVIRVYNNGTLIGESWVQKNPTVSTVDYDVSATDYTPDSDTLGGTLLGKVDKIRVNLFAEGEDVTLAVYPGETITMTAESKGNSDILTFFRWIEEF